jgi:hypothetical protein
MFPQGFFPMPQVGGSGGAGAGFTLADLQAELDARLLTAATLGGLSTFDPATTPVTAGTVTDKAGYALAPAGLDAITLEAGINARQGLALIFDAAPAGLVSGLAPGQPGGTIVVRDHSGANTRITATIDADGNRTAVTLNPPA